MRIFLTDAFMTKLETYCIHQAGVEQDYRLHGYYVRVARSAAGKMTTDDLRQELQRLLGFALDAKMHRSPEEPEPSNKVI
jgi:hypothetical protein